MTNFNQSPNQSPNITGSRFSTAVSRVSELMDRVRLGRIEGNIIEKQDQIQDLNKDIEVRSTIAEASGEHSKPATEMLFDKLRPLTKSQLKFRRKMERNSRSRTVHVDEFMRIADSYQGVADRFSGDPEYIAPKLAEEKEKLQGKAAIVARNALLNGDPSLEQRLNVIKSNATARPTYEAKENLKASMENPLIAGKKGLKPDKNNEKRLNRAERAAQKKYKVVRDYKNGEGKRQKKAKRRIAIKEARIQRLEQKAAAIRARRP
jgi:hypothetical protein